MADAGQYIGLYLRHYNGLCLRFPNESKSCFLGMVFASMQQCVSDGRRHSSRHCMRRRQIRFEVAITFMECQ